MRVGLLTHHWPGNFGANLQALSTLLYVRSKGHECTVLNYRPPEMLALYRRTIPSEQFAVHEKFCNDELNQTEIALSEFELLDVVRNLDLNLVVCGSDAVLRLTPNATREDFRFPNPFWLRWTERCGIDKSAFISVSAMGSRYFDLSFDTREGIRRAVEKLDFLSVRDSWTRVMLLKCGVSYSNIRFCPDPTVKLEHLIENRFASEPKYLSDRYIIVSIYSHMFTRQWREELVKIGNEKGFRVVGLPNPNEEIDGPYDYCVKHPLDPFEWYRWIRGSCGYIGVRFHPVMISMNLGVPFVALDEYDRPICFRNRFLQFIYWRVEGFRRSVSKTYDLCRRTQQAKYCLGPLQYDRYSPRDLIDLLLEDRMVSAPRGEDFDRAFDGLFNSLDS